MSSRIAYGTILAADFVALCDFYSRALDLPEILERRNAAFRALDAGTIAISFTPLSTYDTLGIAEFANPTGITQYLTFEVDTDAEVVDRAATAVERGGRLLRPAYETKYGSLQTVLADPEGNVFRINHFRR